MENMFEKTMLTCLESRKSVERAKSTTSTPNRKKINESIRRTRPLTEEEEMDIDYRDPEEQKEMDDIQDDVVVVVDPELDADEVEGAAQEAQDIIDGTPEGEVPSTDEYIGDMTYTCPICGNTFFSDVEISAGDTCPVCGEIPTNFVLAGEVTEAEEAEEPADTEAPVEEEPVEAEEPADVEELETEEPAEAEESFRRNNRRMGTRMENRRHIRRPAHESARTSRPAMKRNTTAQYYIDESTFNPIMGRFIRENYRNARSFRITGARLNSRKELTLECVITFKTGNTKKVNLKTEGFRAFNGKRAEIDFRESGAFKTESKSKNPPFIFTTSMERNVIKCEGLKYNFVTKVSEGKRNHVFGKVMKESSRPAVRHNTARHIAERRNVSRPSSARRVSERTVRPARKVSEGRVVSRPSVRRTVK